MIKIDMASNDVNNQIELLKHFPGLAEKHYRPVIVRDTKLLENIISPNIPVGMTGRAASTFGSKVSGSGTRLKGTVGWYDGGDPWYPNVLEYGSRTHPVNAGRSIRTKAKAERFNKGYAKFGNVGGQGGTHILVNGSWKTVTTVKGMAPRKFMANGFEVVRPLVENDLFVANERIIADLAAK